LTDAQYIKRKGDRPNRALTRGSKGKSKRDNQEGGKAKDDGCFTKRETSLAVAQHEGAGRTMARIKEKEDQGGLKENASFSSDDEKEKSARPRGDGRRGKKARRGKRTGRKKWSSCQLTQGLLRDR